jgi:hypothetical protein
MEIASIFGLTVDGASTNVISKERKGCATTEYLMKYRIRMYMGAAALGTALSIATGGWLPAHAASAGNTNLQSKQHNVADGPLHRSDYLTFSDDGRTVTDYYDGDGHWLGSDPYTAQARYNELMQAKAAIAKAEKKAAKVQRVSARAKAKAAAERAKERKDNQKAGKRSKREREANRNRRSTAGGSGKNS